MKPDERELLTTFAKEGGSISNGASLREIGERLGIPDKRVEYLAIKWSGKKGWYDYGVVCDMGWLTDKGRLMAAGLATTPVEEEE